MTDHLFGVLRHGNLGHLLTNCVLLGVGGWLTEPRIGSLQTLMLAALCAVLGVFAELVLSGPGFVGMSGVAYGLISFGVLATSPPAHRSTTALLIAVALAAEFALLRSGTAVYTHLASALTGGGLAMFASLFGNKGPTLKPMKWEHVARVVEIIGQTDEDDAAEAESTFLDHGYDNMFVLIEKGTVLGVTGFGVDDQVPDLAWLSWTYLDKAETGRGLGAQMLNDLLGSLSKQGVRKIFIETSDYEDFGKKIYGAAHKLYEEFGANVELTLPDYHAPGEAKIIYGLINPEADDAPAPEQDDESTGLMVTGVERAPETEDVAGLTWQEAPVGVAGLQHYLSQAGEQAFRMAVLAIPSDLSSANADALVASGFEHQGTLKDYYFTGLHQEWWTHTLDNL